MKTLNAIISKGPEDFGAWLKDFKGVYGAGNTPGEALSSLIISMKLYAKHNSDAPDWLKKGSYRINTCY